jgi:hypothetical protein
MTSSLSAGTNALLRLGAPVTGSGDVLELFDLVPAASARNRLGAMLSPCSLYSDTVR